MLQLEDYTMWRLTPLVTKKKLALSTFPAIALELGTTKYTAFDPTGKAASGEQAFTLTLFFTKPENMFDSTRQMRSDSVTSIEQFVNQPVYIPPSMLPGDNYRIDRVVIDSIDGWHYNPGETRFELSVSAKYLFTLF